MWTYMDSPVLFPTRIGERASASNAQWICIGLIVTIIVIEKNVCNWSIIFQLQLNYTFICVFKLLS